MGKSRLDLSALDLKLLAMAAMLVDHMGYLLFPTAMWMRYVGRLAFPIFAFQIAEGWYRTHDREKYTLRLLICAVVSEVPFDLAFSGTPVDAGYQNVLWTFFIAAAALWAADALQERLHLPLPLAALPAAGAGYLLGEWMQADYFGPGVLTVLVFALCRQWHIGRLPELAAMLVINGWLLPSADMTLWGVTLPVELLATAALLPIWLYRAVSWPWPRPARNLVCILSGTPAASVVAGPEHWNIRRHIMAKNKEEKTNVMRTLEQKKIPYTPHTYDPNGPIDGVSVAQALGHDPACVFKTLVTRGASGGYYVFDIPVAENLDLKKAARAVGEKSVAMLPQKELLPLTGYVHGGCSPVGMKKQFPTVFHATAADLPAIMVSAGRIGHQVQCDPQALLSLLRAKTADIIVD